MKLFRKYLLMFAILGLAVLAFSVMAHNVSATDHEPNITSSPVLRVNDNSSYSYSLLADQPGTWAFTSNASFLSMSGNVIFGTPHYEIGSYYVRITFTNSNGTAYQNYTLTVRPEQIISIPWEVLVIALAIVGLMTYAGMRDHNFMLLSGICWSSVSYIVIIPLSMPLAMIGVVIGLLLCLWGVYKLVIA
jgi:hypothetical protein